MTAIQKQAILYKLDHLPLSGVDGIWGDASKEATKAMQRAFGLEEDGIWGKQTDAAVRRELGMEQEQTGTFWEEIEYFTREEFRCPCGKCDGFPASPREILLREADALRRFFGAPVTVTSGVRCSAHNAAVGGVANSRHLAGKAMDFSAAGKTAPQILEYLAQRPNIRYAYAIDSRHVHMDVT